MSTEPDADVAQVMQAMVDLHTAMTRADTEKIGSMLADDYTLVHITGYLQSRAEWLDVIATRRFAYHAITVDTSTLSARLNGRQAELSGRGVFDATIDGLRAPWRLQFTMSLTKKAGRWQFARSRYSSF